MLAQVPYGARLGRAMNRKLLLAFVLTAAFVVVQGALASQASHAPGVIDLANRAANITFQAGQFKFATIAAAGDFDGDSVQDLAIQEGDFLNSLGAVHVFKGASLVPGANFDLATSPADTLVLSSNALGVFYVVAAGDVNGDGIDDIVAGASDADDPLGRNSTGAVVATFGSTTLPASINLGTQAPDLVIYGPTPAASGASYPSFGGRLVVADVNGDVDDDIVTSSSQGVFVVYGGAHLTPGTVIELDPPTGVPGDTAVVQGVLKAPILQGADSLQVLLDVFTVLSGPPTPCTTTGLAVTWAGATPADAPDFNVLSALVTNGTEVRIRGTYSENPVDFGGQAPCGYLLTAADHFLKDANIAGDIVLTGPTNADVTISGVASAALAAGDLNDDGITDLVMTHHDFFNPDPRALVQFGATNLPAFLDLSGNTADLNVLPPAPITGGLAGPAFGISVTTGDLNGDGIDDLAVGDPFEANTFPETTAGSVYVV